MPCSNRVHLVAISATITTLFMVVLLQLLQYHQQSSQIVPSFSAAPKTRLHAECDARAVETVSSKYQQVQTTPGDINEHMPVIYGYVKQAQHATEIGVRGVVSSWAFLKAGIDRMSQEKRFTCLLYTSPSPRDRTRSRMPSSA